MLQLELLPRVKGKNEKVLALWNEKLHWEPEIGVFVVDQYSKKSNEFLLQRKLI